MYIIIFQNDSQKLLEVVKCILLFVFLFFWFFFLWNKNTGLKNSWQSKPIFFNFSCKISSLVIVKQMNQHKSGMKIRQFWEFFLWLFVLHNKKYRKHMMKNCFLFSVFNNVFFFINNRKYGVLKKFFYLFFIVLIWFLMIILRNNYINM